MCYGSCWPLDRSLTHRSPGYLQSPANGVLNAELPRAVGNEGTFGFDRISDAWRDVILPRGIFARNSTDCSQPSGKFSFVSRHLDLYYAVTDGGNWLGLGVLNSKYEIFSLLLARDSTCNDVRLWLVHGFTLPTLRAYSCEYTFDNIRSQLNLYNCSSRHYNKNSNA